MLRASSEMARNSVLIPGQNLQESVFKCSSTQIESFKPDILTQSKDRLS